MSDNVSQYCIACGHGLVAGAAFCTECGHEVGTPPAPDPAPVYASNMLGQGCTHCGGDGSRLDPDTIYCPSCRWLRPLGNDYFVDLDAFVWQMDAQAMQVLNNSGPIASAAHSIAERYGRPVFEAATNGIRLSERQMPEIFDMAVRAARLLSLPHLPEVYISGQRMWDVYSLGGYSGSFISIGSVLINFKPQDLLFLIAREMGHVRAGHAYWSTAMQFLMGQSRGQGTILGEGVFQFLNPGKLIESAIEAPMMRWARHSQITADRAATLVTGDLDCARRVLTQWAMKSFPVTGKLNLEAWLEQEAAADDPYLQLSEWTMSTEPYLAPRLKVLADYSASDEFREWHRYIAHYTRDAGLKDLRAAESGEDRKDKARKPPSDTERLTCAACGTAMRVPSRILQGDKPVNVRCPNKACRKVLRVKPRRSAPAQPDGAKLRAEKARAKVRLTCVACSEPMMVNRADLGGGEPVNVRCPNADCGEVLTIKPKAAAAPKPERPDLMAD
ncbi:MAG: M48 family metalloprotease [Pseudomonadota bacterium]